MGYVEVDFIDPQALEALFTGLLDELRVAAQSGLAGCVDVVLVVAEFGGEEDGGAEVGAGEPFSYEVFVVPV